MVHKFGMLEALRRIAPIFSGSSRAKDRWRRAQDGEFEWWSTVSAEGYGGQNREAFIASGQRDWLLSQLQFLGQPLEYWTDKTIVEFGSGPAGFVEYIAAKRKVAVEPLIERYRKVFPHLSQSEVEYHACPAEEADSIQAASADLVICFNVLDHTFEPERIIRQMSRVAKPGSDLLFQVNVYRTQEEIDGKSGLHAELHPHSFFPHQVTEMLRRNGFKVSKESCSTTANPSGEYYFLCAGQRA